MHTSAELAKIQATFPESMGNPFQDAKRTVSCRQSRSDKWDAGWRNRGRRRGGFCRLIPMYGGYFWVGFGCVKWWFQPIAREFQLSRGAQQYRGQLLGGNGQEPDGQVQQFQGAVRAFPVEQQGVPRLH